MSLENTVSSLEDKEETDELKPGTELMHGQYVIEEYLAAGGFGITYLAKDSLNRRVVIKECFPGNLCRRDNSSVTARSRAHQNEVKSIVGLFSQEAMSLARTDHPNIVGVHQVFEENNTAYMALDYVQGLDLLEILEDNPDSLKPEMIEAYLLKVLDAVGHIHQKGMLHRDIAPDNIIISETGEPILIDFGAARESTNAKVTQMLSTIRVVKEGYSPQEFYIAGSDQPPSCDLYSLAASFYHIITKELPPDSQVRLSARASGDPDPYVSLGEKTNDYSEKFVTALDKAMSILPRERMQSAEEWTAYISDAARVATLAAPAPFEPIAAVAQKKTIAPILLGATAVAAIAGGAFFVLPLMQTETPPVTSGPSEVATADIPALIPLPTVEDLPVPEETVAVLPSELIPNAPVEPAQDSQSELNSDLPTSDSGVDFFVAMARSREGAANTPEPSTVVAAPVETSVSAPSNETTANLPFNTVLVPAIPFVLSNATPGTITDVSADAPSWMTDGMQIVSINGQPVATNEGIEAAFAEAASQNDAGSFEISLGLSDPDTDTTAERTITLLKEKHTSLLNGLQLVTREDNSVWTTKILVAPEASDFQVGDTLVSYLSTLESLDGPNSLQAILERELPKGTTSFNFVIDRAGDVWIQAFQLAALVD
ncbi:protein kinase [Rhodobacteraceae bacterium]|nr:protein kinase [Paracoccaceae bacterium]